MNNQKLTTKKLFKEFIHICKENDIWYSMDKISLVQSVNDGKIVDWDNDINVMMSVKSYEKLRRLFPNRVIDSFDVSQIENLRCFFIYDSRKFSDKQPLLIIRVVVPTSLKKLRKFKSPFYLLENKIKRREINIRSSINDLNTLKHQGYILLDDRKKDMDKWWIQVLSFSTSTGRFDEFDVEVIKEYENVLKYWYKSNYDSIEERTLTKQVSPLLKIQMEEGK